jgi:glucokinase
MRKDGRFILGVDIGGSHITAGLVDLDERMVLKDSLVRKAVDRHGTAEEILRAWTDTLQMVDISEGELFSGIGLAMPGPFKYDEGISLIRGFDKYEALYGINIREQLSQRLNLPGELILFRNDAEAFLEGELFAGAAKGYNNLVIGITLGTGLGSAKSVNGITIDAERSGMIYKNDKIEEFVSTRGLLKIYEELSGRKLKNAKEISDLYENDKNAERTFATFAGHLAWFLEQFIKDEQPGLVVIGGNIANAWDLFMSEVIRRLELSLISVPKIVKAELEENAALIGAACNFLSPVQVMEK